MAVTFLEPGGDADFGIAFGNGFWKNGTGGTPSVATDFVHGGHIKSIKYRAANSDNVNGPSVLSDSGSRISFYIYLVALPTATADILRLRNGIGTTRVSLRITSGGVLQLWSSGAQIGSNGSTLSTGTWYRISLAYTITSTSVNRFELFKNAASDISITNATIAGTGLSWFGIGNYLSDTTFDFRSSDHYVDDSSSLTDTGDIWVTAKRPNANGTNSDFNTQIGSGGSGYGSGHSPQVNERPLDTTNGWSAVVAIAVPKQEDYIIEGKATGDIDISAATIVDYMGWVSAKALTSETGSIIVNSVASNISLTTTITVFTKMAGSSTYPAGNDSDIGILTSTTLTTVSLYEAGVIVAYIPNTTTTKTITGTARVQATGTQNITGKANIAGGAVVSPLSISLRRNF